MADHVAYDVSADDEQRHAKILTRRLKKTIPQGWAQGVEALAQPMPGESVWRRGRAWIDRLEAFKKEHGQAGAWALDDWEICQRAKKITVEVGQLLKLPGADGPLTELEQLETVRHLCAAIGVDSPVSLTAQGAINRGLCHLWWRRALRKKVARTVEHGAIKLGLVNRNGGGYASNDAVQRRTKQLERNEKMMAATLLRNEAGQVYTLAELAVTSVANRDVRRGELMTRIRGCEEYADAAGHEGVFFTLTCPSRYHAMTAAGAGGRAIKNRKYKGATPREAQLWLRETWARVRADLARQQIKMYGFRVAEPHHDGCPHWHALLWFVGDGAANRAIDTIKSYWLEDDGHEPGARKNRVNAKRMMTGGAAGYIAKYVAKNIGGSIDIGPHLDGTGGVQQAFAVDTGFVQGYQRVDAWAATWGIRQFQAVGQPPVGAWRELRRVTRDQIDKARLEGDGVAWRLWGAVHRDGDEQACWRRYMEHMGGVCQRRGDWALTMARREVSTTNDYGEAITRKTTVGVQLRSSGRWLVSRRQRWARVADGAAVGAQAPSVRAAAAAPWTGFNNCTARLTNTLRRAFLGRGRHESSDWDGSPPKEFSQGARW